MSCQLSTPRVDSYKAFRALWLLIMLNYSVRGIVKLAGYDTVMLPDTASALPGYVWVVSWLLVAVAGVVGLRIPGLIHAATVVSIFLNVFIALLYVWEETRVDVLFSVPYIVMAGATLFTALGLIGSRGVPRD